MVSNNKDQELNNSNVGSREEVDRFLELMKLHDKLKANSRERKSMLKRYNDLKGQIPFFAEDPLVDSE